MKTNNEQNEREISKMETSFITVKFKKDYFMLWPGQDLLELLRAQGHIELKD